MALRRHPGDRRAEHVTQRHDAAIAARETPDSTPVVTADPRRRRLRQAREGGGYDLDDRFDFVIIGAGSAGEAAASLARARGTSVAVTRWRGHLPRRQERRQACHGADF